MGNIKVFEKPGEQGENILQETIKRMRRSNIKRDSPELIKDTVHGLQSPENLKKDI